jgi:hypothetical protein
MKPVRKLLKIRPFSLLKILRFEESLNELAVLENKGAVLKPGLGLDGEFIQQRLEIWAGSFLVRHAGIPWNGLI